MRIKNIPFETEDDLRRKGYSKTPDVRLLVPIALPLPNGKHQIINWIDSKAMFGDYYAFHQNKNQLTGYLNRFGPGI